MLRTITITLLMLVSFAGMLPICESAAHGIRQSIVSKRQNRHHYRRHSRAWWRRYRARLRRRRAAAAALAAHRRAMMLPTLVQPAELIAGSTSASPKVTTGLNNASATANAEMKFRANTGIASIPGQATLSVVAQSRPTPGYLSAREAGRLLAGVAVADLRRIVIDKMIHAGGWVTNDYRRDVNGHAVFVVTAQTPGDFRSPEKTWNFYFTEINGRIYSLTTNTPREFSDRMAAEAEAFISSLHATSSSNSQPSIR